MSRERIDDLTELVADGLAGETQVMELAGLVTADPQAGRMMAELLLFEGELRGLYRPDLTARIVAMVEADQRERVQAGVMDQITASDSRRWSKSRSGRLQAPRLPGTGTARRQRGFRRHGRGTGRHVRHPGPSIALEPRNQPAGESIGRHRRPRRPASSVWIFAMAAGLLLVLGLGIHLASTRRVPASAQPAVVAVPTSPSTPELMTPTIALDSDAPLRLQDPSGASRELAAGHIAVPVGGMLTAASPTGLRFADGSVLALRAGSDLRFADPAAGFRLKLERGHLVADVAAQASGRDWRVATGVMEVRVLGTRFAITVDGASHGVALEEGSVACRAHGREVTLVPWQRATSNGFQLRVSGDDLELYLVDATADRVLWERGELQDGGTIDLTDLGLTDLNFVVLAPTHYEKLQITRTLDGEPIRWTSDGGRTEAFVPFTVFGDNTSGDYYEWTARAGTLQITAGALDGAAPALRRSWTLTLK